ncbi:hypothetical protein MLD38_023133 [Melastoma candidum]|uniref:Uncharacterized protein n=1 Tax=Melastoma candidum TaxID=119954 RepID=A0ACB9QLI0_9MYRT|nr:hypothetical protein MLD38_023133 [Melastoma candidum]
MSLLRILLRRDLLHHPRSSTQLLPPILTFSRSFAFSSVEEAAAERRRRKRLLRIQPPRLALNRDPPAPPPPRDPNAPRLPDSTSSLVGLRLSLHNRVQSLIRASDLDAASAVARHSVFSSTRPTVFTCNAVVDSMYRAKRYSDAIAHFHFFFNQSNIVPNVVSYNYLIKIYCDMGNVDKGLELLQHIVENAPFGPSCVTYRHLTKGLIDVGRIDEAVALLRQMLDKGHAADSLVYNNLIKGFLELGKLEKAEEFFDELKERCVVYDGVVTATFMDWYFKQGKAMEALESYKAWLEKKYRMVPSTCNVLLEVLLRYGQKKEAWAMFGRMLDDHTPPTFLALNSDSYNLMVNECFKEGKIDEALATFRMVGTKGASKPFVMDIAGYNNMIIRYCELGLLDEGYGMYKEATSKSLSGDVSSHRPLIEAYLKAGKFDDALSMLHKMVDTNLRVVASFGIKIFEDLIKSGKVVDCVHVLLKMSEKDPKPDPMFYEIVLKGLCSAKELDEASNLIGQMVNHGIGFTPSLREVLTASFAEVGRREEIDRQLNTNNWGHMPRRPPQRGGFPHSSPSTGPQFFRSQPNMQPLSNNSMPSGHTQGVQVSQPYHVAGFNSGLHAPALLNNTAPYNHGEGQGLSSQVSGPWGHSQVSGSPYIMQNSDPRSPSSSYDNGHNLPYHGNVPPYYHGGQSGLHQIARPSGPFPANGSQYTSQISSPYSGPPRSNATPEVSYGSAGIPQSNE